MLDRNRQSIEVPFQAVQQQARRDLYRVSASWCPSGRDQRKGSLCKGIACQGKLLIWC